MQRVYIVRPAIFVPAALSVAAVVVAIEYSWWSLIALPFLWLASICAKPNMNLADGCLAYVAMFVGLILLTVVKPFAVPMLAGSTLGYYLSAIEKYIRLRPFPDDERPRPSNGPDSPAA